MSIDLKPCPFCNGPAKEEYGFVGCCDHNCGNYVGVYTEKEWNRRAPVRVKMPQRYGIRFYPMTMESVKEETNYGKHVDADDVIAALKAQGVEVIE